MTSQTESTTSASSLSNQQMGAVTIAMILLSSVHYIFGRMLAPYFNPYASSFGIMIIAAIEILLYLIVKRTFDLSVLRKNFWFFVSIGILVALGTVFSYASIKLIDAGSASLLSRFSTVFTLLLSYFWLREALTRNEILGAVICTAGALLISFQPSDVFRLGSLLLIAGVFFYALHVAVVKRYGEEMDFGNFFFFRVASTAVFLLIFMGLTGNLTFPDVLRGWEPLGAYGPINGWMLLFIVGTVDVVISRVIYYWALRQMRLGIHTIALTVTPVITVVWSVLIFNERPSTQALIGGGIVLLGILLVVTTQQRQKSSNA